MGKKFDQFVAPAVKRLPGWFHPNVLSTAQVLFLIPVFYWYKDRPWLAAIIWAMGKLSDLLDGPVARIRGQKTTLGGFLDASSDKIYFLVPLFFACGFWETPRLSWPILVDFCLSWPILGLEVVLTTVRIIEYVRGTKTSANRWGKVKTWLQSFALAFVLTRHWLLVLAAPLVFIAAIWAAWLSLAGHLRDLRSSDLKP